MAQEYKLSYTAQDIDERLGAIPDLTENVASINTSVNDLFEKISKFSGRYNSIENALNGIDSVEDGIIATYMIGDNLNVLLLDDITSTTTININKDCTLHLNGKKLSFTTQEAFLNINAANEVTIDGTVANSSISKSLETVTSNSRLLSATDTTLNVNGGVYSLTAENGTKALVAIHTKNVGTNLNMKNCVVIVEGITSGDIKGTQVAGQSTFENCKFNVTSLGSSNYTIGSQLAASNTEEINYLNCIFNVFGTLSNVRGIDGTAATINISNSNIEVSSKGQGVGVYGIINGGNINVDNCTIYADGYSDCDTNNDGEQEAYGVSAIGGNASSITINGGYYWAAREPLSIFGTARINGGVYEGCQHGGAYMQGTDIKVKNATFRNVEYNGEVGWNAENWHAGAVYCGNSDSNNANVYFDNCRFESDVFTSHAITAKYTNSKVYLSNCVIDGIFGDDFRADTGNYIYVGKDVFYDTNKVPNYGGVVDTTTYVNQEFGFKTESTNCENLIDVKTGLLQERLENTILYTPQSLTEEQKAQARENIGVINGDSSSGIYLGSGDMPEGYSIQIDPTGMPVDLEQEIKDVLEIEKYNNSYELIEYRVLDQEYRSFNIKNEPDGTPYKFKAVMVRIYTPGGTENQAGYVYPLDATGARMIGGYFSPMVSSSGQRTSNFISFPMFGHWFGFALGSGNGIGNNGSVNNYPAWNGTTTVANCPYIEGLNIYVATSFPINSTFEIWGVRV